MGGSDPSAVTNAQNKFLPWEQYVPGATSGAYNRLMPKLESKADMGLTPEETALYKGQGLKGVSDQFAGAGKSLLDTLTRSGVKPGSGAAIQAFSDLNRGKAMAGAGALGNIANLSVQRKDTNTNRLLQAIGLPGSPAVSGSTSTTTQSGGGS